MKKILPILIILIGITSCRDRERQSSEQLADSTPSITIISLDSILPGKWSICSRGSGNDIIQANVCPQIIFNENSTALLMLNYQGSETMKWRIMGDTLLLDHLAFWTKDSTAFFSDSIYKISKTEDSIFLNIRITQPEKNYYYNMGRVKHPVEPVPKF